MKKLLLVPLITPLRRREDHALITDLEKEYQHTNFYVCSTTVHDLRDVLDRHTDYIIPTMEAGEGDKLDFELWKQQTHSCIISFGVKKVIPCVMKTEYAEDAIKYLSLLTGLDKIVLSYPSNATLFKKINKKIKVFLYLTPDSEARSNDDLIKFIKKHKSRICAVCDSRNQESPELINDLISKIGGKIPIFQCSEKLYAQTTDCAGGFFSLANIEPKLFKTYLSDRKFEKLVSLEKKFSHAIYWVSQIKKEFYGRKKRVLIQYSTEDFMEAISKYFEAYSEENFDNLHVQKFNINKSEESIAKTLFADLLSYQTMFFRYNDLENESTPSFLFIPVKIIVHEYDKPWFSFSIDFESPIYNLKNLVKSKTDIKESFFTSFSKEWFDSNFMIEQKIFIDNKFPLKGAKNFKNLPKNPFDLSVFNLPNKIKKLLTGVSNVVSTFELKYIPEIANTMTEIKIGYIENPYMNGGVPRQVFDFISRVSLFTKRNRMAMNQLEQHALQAAVAQIFARNFAHNIGSHVAIRATNKVVKNRIIELLAPDLLKTVGKSRTQIERQELANEELVDWLDYASGIMDMYEVNRNEFLAEYKLPPKNRMFYKDVILPFCTNTLLTDNIAAGEGIKYKDINHNRLKIRVFHDTTELKATYSRLSSYTHNPCNPICYPDTFPYVVKVKPETDNETIDLEDAFNHKIIEGDDIEICLASEHSIYSILENFIRNAAKHNSKVFEEKKEKELEVFIKVTEYDDDYYYFYLYDNVSGVTKKTLQGFKERLAEDLFSPQGELNRVNLGIADMKINAHLLQSGADISKENLRSAIDIMACDCGFDTDPTAWEELSPFLNKIPDATKEEEELQTAKRYRFGYRFKLSKPKKVVWIGNDTEATQWNKYGITLYKQVKNFNNDNKALLAAHQFAILETEAVKDLDKKALEALLLNLPFRVLLNCTASELSTTPTLKTLYKDRRIQIVETKIELPSNPENNFKLIQDCWAAWLKQWLNTTTDKFGIAHGVGKEKAHLYLYLEDSGRIEEWKKVEKEWNCDLVKTTFLTKTDLSKYTPSVTLSSDEFNVFYDHHANGFGKCEKPGFNKSLNNGSYFQFDKSSEDFATFFYPPDKLNDKKQILFEAVEAGLMNIAVLDERLVDILKLSNTNITKITKDNGFFSKAFGMSGQGAHADLLNIGKTFFITSIKKSPQNNGKQETEHLTTTHPNLELWQTKDKDNVTIDIECPEHLKGQGLTFDGLIIHRTYLSKLLPDSDNKKDDSDNKKNELMTALNEKFKQVIVISGGGRPHSLGVEVYYQPFSNVNRNFAKYQSKMSLIKLF